MTCFDAAIVGAGPAGLTLARALLAGPLAGRRLLVLDSPSSRADAHALAWWADRPTPYDALATAAWDRVRVATPAGPIDADLGPYRYRVLAGEDLQDAARADLADRPEVTWVEAGVDEVRSGPDAVELRADDQRWRASWAFDSRYHLRELDDRPGVRLIQRFRGWTVRAPVDTFDPTLPTLMDLRFPQGDGLRFAYVLPRSPREALVELVAMGGDADLDDVEPWLRAAWGVPACEATVTEAGATPMASRPWPRASGRVLRIGVAGGRLKPSTGYGFLRMIDDADAIAASLTRRGHPFDLPRPAARWGLLDAMMLRLIARRPADAARAFDALFRRRPAPEVLRFLDERASCLAAARLGAALPIGPMLAANLGGGGRRA